MSTEGCQEGILAFGHLGGILLIYHYRLFWLSELSLKFFRLLNFHTIHEHRFRELILLLQLPAYAALKWGHVRNMGALNILYTGPLFLVPVLSLGISWWILRKTRPQLFIWPVLSVLLGNIYNHHWPDSEHIMVAQLTWPLILGALFFDGRGKFLWISLMVAVLFFLHPASVISFSLLILILLLQQRGPHPQKSLYLKICLGLGAVSLLRFLTIFGNGFEMHILHSLVGQQRTDMTRALWRFFQENHFLPLLSLISLWAAGFMIFLPRRLPLKRGSCFGFFLLICVASYALPFINSWDGRFNSLTVFFRFSFPVVLPFYLMGMAEHFWFADHGAHRWKLRRNLLPWIGISYLLTVVTFCWSWDRVATGIAMESKKYGELRCLPLEQLSGVPSPFGHYFIMPHFPLYFLLNGPKNPDQLLWHRDDCRNFYRYKFLGFLDLPRQLRPWNAVPPDLYFDFSRLKRPRVASTLLKVGGDGL